MNEEQSTNEEESSPLKTKENIPNKDQIVSVIGEKGIWQLEKSLIVFLVSIPGLGHIFLTPFLFPKTDFWCSNENNTSEDVDMSNCSLPCNNYSFDKSFWIETVVSEFGLVCENSYLPTIAKMIFFSGFAIGTFVAGIVSDIWGRKRAILVFSLLTLISGIVTSLMPVFPAFVAMWWLVGIAAVANFTVAFVWTIELGSGKWKVIMGMAMQFTWPFARGMGVAAAFIWPNWRTMLQIVSAPCIAAPVLIYFLPESPRWLIAKGRISEAKEILAAGAKRNKKEINIDDVTIKQPQAIKKGTFLDVMKYPRLRIKTFIMYFNWFISSFMLYGIALNWQSLIPSGGLFVNFAISAVLDFPAKLLALISLVWLGRRLPYISLTFLASFCFMACLFIPRNVFPGEIPIVVLSLTSSFCASATFAMLWMWTSELMPTYVRNAGVGSCSLVARIGGILATTVSSMAEVSTLLPIGLFTTFAMLSAIISLFLPETHGCAMPDTVDQSEQVKLRKVSQLCQCSIKHQ